MDFSRSDSLQGVGDDDIVERCRKGECLGMDVMNLKVVRIQKDIVVKHGIQVRKEEAMTQYYAYTHFSGAILRVPNVFRFFVRPGIANLPVGYIVMEYVDGVCLERTALSVISDLIPRIANAMQYLRSVEPDQTQAPGPPEGGEAHGYLWTDHGARTPFHSMHDMESWMNERLRLSRQRPPMLDLSGTHLVFAHMDVSPRNILLTDKNELCFLDWEFAGYYPQYFEEFCLRWCSRDDATFVDALLSRLPSAEDEKLRIALTEIIRVNTMYA